MIPVPAYQGKTIGVFGLARTGLASCRALEASGARVLAWDDNADRRAPVTDLAVDLYDHDFADLDALLLAPGVPLTHPDPHPLVRKAQAAGVPIIGDVEIFQAARPSLPPHRLVAVTGTNGKSTTTALMDHVLGRTRHPSVAAGNIGVPVLSLKPLPEGGVYVFETSSFQIDLTLSLTADVAILLNMTPDHLDRHGDMAGYVKAKARLFEMQAADGTAVISVDDAHCRPLAQSLPQRVIPISVCGPVSGGVYADDSGRLIDATGDEPLAVGSFDANPALAGRHNLQNAAAVYAAGRALGLASADIATAMAAFPGLAHRMEPLGEVDGIMFVNDSKATNADAAARALKAFDKVHWIAGGRAKDRELGPVLDALGSVKHAYLIGEARGVLTEALEGRVPVSAFEALDGAVAAARAQAAPGDVVLLSPACASFDQYPDFEARGDHFRRLVGAVAAQGVHP
mgnify:CR=1 FL=1